MSLLHRQSNIFRVQSDLDLQVSASHTVTALRPGGTVASASSFGSVGIFTTTSMPLHPGHGFAVNDRVMIGLDPNTFTVVVQVSGNTVDVIGVQAVITGDVIVNLGIDTGTTGPNYDGSPVLIYSTPDTTTLVDESRVTTNEDGEYDYYHVGDANLWELIRGTDGEPVEIIKGAYEVAPRSVNEIQYVHLYATSGVGTVAAPWVGWESAVADGVHAHFAAGVYNTDEVSVGVTLSNEAANTSITGDGSGRVRIQITSGSGQFRVYGSGTGTRVLQGVTVKGLCVAPAADNTSTGLISLENFEMQCEVDDLFVDVGSTYTIATGIYLLNCSHTNLGMLEVRGYSIAGTSISCTTGLKMYTDDGAQRGNIHFANVNIVNCTTALKMYSSSGSFNNITFSSFKAVNTIALDGTLAVDLDPNSEQIVFTSLHMEKFANGLDATGVEGLVITDGLASQIHNVANNAGVAYTITNGDGGHILSRIDTCYNGYVLAGTTTRHWIQRGASGTVTGAYFTDTSSGANVQVSGAGILGAFSIGGRFLSTGGFSIGTRVAAGTIASGVITLPTSPTSNNLTVDTEAAAGSDDLDTITGGADGDIIVLSAVNDARTVVVKNNTGNIKCGADRSLDNSLDIIVLQKVGSNWLQFAFNDNGV